MNLSVFILAQNAEDVNLPAWLWIIAFIPGLLIFAYHYLKAKWWEQRFLPSTKGKSSGAFMNAYIASSVLIIKLDRRDADLKRRILHKKIVKIDSDPNKLWETFDQIWENEISESRISRWCVKHLNEVERSELIYLLVELALVDGSMLAREHAFLVKLMKGMKLPLRELKGMMASHYQRMRREEAKHQQQRKTHQKTYQQARKPSKSAVETALEILGLQKDADQAAIKKAYRSLAKKHHPDRFATQDEAIIKAAEARFIEIQEAYETVSE
jgi:DnaJ-domain-containing protein 1